MVETLNNSKTFKIKNHTIKCSLGIMGMAIPKIPTIIPNRTYTNSWRLTQLSHLKNSTTSEEQDTFNLSSFICFKILGESKQYSPNEERQTNTNTGRRHIDTHHFRPHKKNTKDQPCISHQNKHASLNYELKPTMKVCFLVPVQSLNATGKVNKTKSIK